MTDRVRNVILLVALVVVGALAIWGWTRKAAPATATAQPVTAQPLDAMGQPYNPPANANAPAYGNNPAYPASSASYATGSTAQGQWDTGYSLPMYASRNYVRTIRQEPPPPPPNETRYVERDRYVPEREYYTDRHGHRHERSKKKSVAIVAGSAAGGAAIGAIAGGGKGAGIGALAGGGAGFIYDRLTHRNTR
jgi:hypothetical protein